MYRFLGWCLFLGPVIIIAGAAAYENWRNFLLSVVMLGAILSGTTILTSPHRDHE